MISRIKQFQKQFAQNKIDAYLVTCDKNISYLTEFPAAESWLLVLPNKAYYITDFRYVAEARKNIKNAKVVEYKDSILGKFSDLIKLNKAKRIGFDDRYVSVSLFLKIKKACSEKISFVSCQNLIEYRRSIKEQKEIRQIKKCLNLNLKAFDYIKRVMKLGMTEHDVYLRLDRYLKSHGASFSFDPIVASGPNSSFPHAKVTNRKIRTDDVVMIDMGVDIAGYKSDLTRMFFLGKITPLMKRIYESVRVAQEKAISRIRPGVKAADIDQEARKHLESNKLAKYFGHSLGHGVGLEIHEDPCISQKNTNLIEENMIFTVEPAVYIPNKFGIRIEDMVLVTKQGCKIISNKLY
ncbi:MAG: aminopeptidase P family protein [Candidatus Omnitrophica bacterium]|nr:aminopeptidase P family protein [Candidatus Omnitrophota bacterium]